MTTLFAFGRSSETLAAAKGYKVLSIDHVDITPKAQTSQAKTEKYSTLLNCMTRQELTSSSS